MTRFNISPTRMERTRQKDRLKTASRAHKLLKDKSDEMVRTFSGLVKQNKTLRQRVENDLAKALKYFMTARTLMTTKEIEDAISVVNTSVSFECTTKNIMGLIVPHVEVATEKDNKHHVFIATPTAFDKAIALLRDLTSLLVDLANIEKTCGMLADEIEKVRRRINSLEYIMIPNINETIKFITMKLDENQRETQIRVMKVKQMQTENL